jgi:hypothetical protein
MLNDIFVCGSSVASGYGKGKVHNQMGNHLKSWVDHLAERSSASNVWNMSMPSKPIGLSTADTVEFVRQYGKKYNTYDRLFVIVEYTIPQYKNWDPVAAARRDTAEEIEIIPITFFRMGKNTDHLTTTGPQDSGIKHLGQKFLKRNSADVDLMEALDINRFYEEVKPADLDQAFVNKYREKSKNWLRYDSIDSTTGERRLSEKKMATYLRYASDEIYSLKRFLEHYNIPYLMFWAGGQTDIFCKKVDRYFGELIETKRLIPMSEFTCNKAAIHWSKESWGVHPDELGHERIGEFVTEWIIKHNLYNRPSTSIFTGEYFK